MLFRSVSESNVVPFVPETAFGIWFLRTHTWEHHVLRVAINDLNAVITPRAGELWKPRDLHFTPEGYTLLAENVARAIRSALPPAP